MKRIFCVPKWSDPVTKNLVYEFGTETECLGTLELETICLIYGHAYNIIVLDKVA